MTGYANEVVKRDFILYAHPKSRSTDSSHSHQAVRELIDEMGTA